MKPLPLSSNQREIWLDQRLHSSLPLYNIGGYLEIDGPIDTVLFETALQVLVRRHDALRTILIPETDGVPTQVFLQDSPTTARSLDFCKEKDPHGAALDWMQRQFDKPFTLHEQPLCELALLKINPHLFQFFGKFHHIVVDGWSIALINKSLADIYSHLARDQEPSLDAPSYTAFISDDCRYMASERYEVDLQYWTALYRTPPEALFTPRHFRQSSRSITSSQSRTSLLTRSFYNQLLAFSRDTESSPFHVMLAALYVYFARTMQIEELTVGVPIRNRKNSDFKNTVGLFAGVSAARFQFGTCLSFGELLESIGNSLRSEYRHQRFPIGDLNRALGLQKLGRKQLFDIQLNYARHDHDIPLDGHRTRSTSLSGGYEQMPLSISIWEFHSAEDVRVDFAYNLAYFDAVEIERIQSHLMLILEQAIDNVKQSIQAIPLLTKVEREQLIAWNQTATPYPENQTAVDLFETQAEKTPDNTAVIFEGQQIQYRELNAKANQLAHDLVALGVGPETLVGIFVARSLDMVIALLGILKSGGAYVPIDPDVPRKRLRFMLDDTAVPVLLTQRHLLERIPASNIQLICLDGRREQRGPSFEKNLARRSNPGNTAYIVYTSGSTGKPKGVMIEHSALSSFTYAAIEIYSISGRDRVLQFSSISFDAAVEEIYPVLTRGGCLVLRNREMLNTHHEFLRACQRMEVTVLDLPTAYWRELIIIPDSELHWPASVRLVIIGGEAASADQIRRWQQTLGHKSKLVNTYGPTEATVVASRYWIPASVTSRLVEDRIENVPIGRPLPNVELHVLDASHRPTPLGVPGELCIAGAGLARGYLNRPRLTAELFVEAELFGKSRRIYRSGDRARWLPDGNLEYLGRYDHQIKLRGFRIELGEIEEILNQHDAIKETVVVLCDPDGNPRLAAYVTLNDRAEGLAETLRFWLKTRLPDYMTPASFTVLDALPLTSNGKIDRKALPPPHVPVQVEQEAAKTETEQLLCTLWSEVLGFEVTNRLSHFFESGGHSLSAARLLSRVRESLGIEAPLRVLFDKPRLSEQAEWLDQQQRGTEYSPILPLAAGEPRVLSFAQEGLWFLAQFGGQGTTYNMSAALRIDGALDEKTLVRSLIALVERQQILRLCFPVVDGQATVQLNPVYCPLSVTDLSRLSEAQREYQVNAYTTSHFALPFNLDTGPLFRLHLFRLTKKRQILLFDMHHIISDGWSLAILARDLCALYDAIAQNQVPRLPSLSIQYTDYASWQRTWLSGEVLERQLGYWAEQLEGAPELLELATDHQRPAVMSYQGQHFKSTLEAKLHQGVLRLSREQGVTVFMTLLTIFKILLYRYTAQTDLLVGSPVANRNRPQTEDLIGLFVNTLVLRSRVVGDQTFSALVKEVRKTALEAYSHQDIPFETVVEHINPSRSPSYSPLFQVMFTLQNMPQVSLEIADSSLFFLEPELGAAKFDLTLSLLEQDDEWVCDWEYNTDLFQRETVARMCDHFRVLLVGTLDRADQRIATLPLLTKAEKEQLVAWGRSKAAYPEDQTIGDLFQAQVDQTPDRIAVVFETRHISYRELSNRAKQLSNYLLALGVGPYTQVGLCIENSLELLIGLLGILEAGGSYVPLDPNYPAERLLFMLDKARLPVLLSQAHLRDRLPSTAAKVVFLDSDWESIVACPQNSSLNRKDPRHLAYVIYTSGSTGRPKGAGVFHQGLSNLLHWFVTSLKLTAQDRTLVISSFSFDLTQKNLLAPLILGGQLHLSSYKHYDPTVITRLVAERRITWLNCTPSTFYPLVQPHDGRTFRRLASIRYAVLGGESIELARLWPWLQAETCRAKLVNSYGPTECTDVCAAYRSDEPTLDQSLPIGRPIPNAELLVLDAYQGIVPVGVPGELYIGGVCVGVGYLGDVEKTVSRFLVHPFKRGQRLYKTGDQVRYLPDGNLEYLGRLDNQIKLRGFRIELGEIETVLSQHQAIQEAIVVLDDSGRNPRLAAYVTLSRPVDDISRLLSSWLKTRLPDYMVPTSFAVLESFPLTPNAKIDRKALPAPHLSNEAEPQAPQTETEHLLCSLWSRVLSLPITSRLSHFFESGGHSLLATQLLSRIRESFDLDMPLQILFERPRLSEQAEWLDRQQAGTKLTEVQPVPEGEAWTLSFAQQRLWFLTQLEGQNPTYNISAALRLAGVLNVRALVRSLTALVERHQSLRICFPVVEGVPRIEQRPVYNPLGITDLSGLLKAEQDSQVNEWIARHAQSPFELSAGPLFRLHLLRRNEEEHILLFNMSHIISDGWSLGVLVRDWTKIYSAYAKGQRPNLPALPLQYTDYAAWQRKWLQGSGLAAEIAYWLRRLRGAPALLQLPTDHPRPARQQHHGGSATFVVPAELALEIRRFSQSNNLTIFMTMLGAFNVLLYRYSGQEDICIGVPVANRNHSQLEDLVGLFLSTLVLRSRISEHGSFQQLMPYVRRTALDAFAHQNVPFELLVEKLRPQRSLSYQPVFQVMFNLINFPDVHQLRLPNLCVKTLHSAPETIAKFDLNLALTEDHNALQGQLEYDAALFTRETADFLVECYLTLLQQVLDHPDAPLSELSLLSQGWKAQVANRQHSVLNLPFELVDAAIQNIPDVFALQVQRYSDRIAVRTPRSSTTYRELDQTALRLATALLDQHHRNPLVALLLPHDTSMIVGIIGTLQAGRAYVPLDVNDPILRLRYILSDTQSGTIVCDNSSLTTAEQLIALNSIINLDRLPEASAYDLPVVAPESYAYLIYTSGSTGQPKGVLQNHRNVLHFIRQYTNNLHINTDDKISQFATYGCDAAVMDILSTLLNGATLYTIDLRRNTVTDCIQWITKERVTLLHSTPSIYRHFVSALEEPLSSVRLVVLGGEPVVADDVQAYRKWFNKSCLFVNLYGQTESSLNTLSIFDHDTAHPRESIPVGQPVDDIEIFLLGDVDTADRELYGEIAVCSQYVALGYWGKESSAFARCDHDRDKRLYRTGDIGRLLPDGALEVIGRRDHQIKLRGFRIELGEIETVLQQYETIKESVVVLYDQHKELRLAAYVTTSHPIDNVDAVLRPWLKARLPDYMVPASLTVLDELPLTASGKVDRNGLPEAVFTNHTGHQAPQSETEQLLCILWSQVLGLPITSRLSHFFGSGGHSLLATLLVSRIRESFGIDMPLRLLFDKPRLSEQAEWLDKQQRGTNRPPIQPIAGDQPRVLSFAQERLWFLAQLEGTSATYNMSAALRITGELDERILEQCIIRLVERHQSLRLCFPAVGGEARCQLNPVYNPLRIADLRRLSKAQQQYQVRQWVARHSRAPFDLGKGPLLRLHLLNLNRTERVLLFNIHHIVSDGWSRRILVRDLCSLYESVARGQQSDLLEVPIQYTDYAAWQRKLLQGEVLERQLHYWTRQLAGAAALLEMPTDFPRPAIQQHLGRDIGLQVPAGLTARLKKLSIRGNVTLFMTLLGAFKFLLYRFSDQSDICVGVPVANRQHSQLEELVGLFLSTVVLRSRVPEDSSFLEFISCIRHTTLNAFAQQDIPFELLVERLRPKRSLSYHPLYQVMFNLVNVPENHELEFPGVRVRPVDGALASIAKLDLSLTLTESPDGLTGRFEYDSGLFTEETVHFLIECYVTLLQQIVDHPNAPLSQLSLLSRAWKARVAEYQHPTPVQVFEPFDCSMQNIPDRFALQVRRYSDRVAVRTLRSSMTYGQLDLVARRLAAALLKKQYDSELIALILPHDASMIVGIIGTLQAGRAYVPLDANTPILRLEYVIRDIKAPMIVCDKQTLEIAERLIAPDRIVNLDGLPEEPARDLPSVEPDRKAYLLYTSGSTGRPKGVIQNHRNLSHFIRQYTNNVHISSEDRLIQLASYCFDAAVMDIFGALLNGASLYPFDLKRGTFADCIQWIAEEQITVYHSTPTIYRHLISVLEQPLGSIRLVALGGEMLSRTDLENYRAYFGDSCLLINGLGPTESTVTLQYFVDRRTKVPRYRVPVGYPVAETDAILLNSKGESNELYGELVFRSRYLALGYWKHRSPAFGRCSLDGEKRLYRSGDIGRLLPNGALEVIGRRDNQVKLRGFRIELGEIESVLKQHDAVEDAVALLYDSDDNPRLAAYVTISRPAGDVPDVLRSWLKARLPEYMLPASFTVLDALPLTPSGKIDRRALPGPDATLASKRYYAPRDWPEIQLVQIWEDLLQIRPVGINDDFFELGGHSLLAMRLVSRIRQIFGRQLPVAVLFQGPTIGELAPIVRGRHQEGAWPTLVPIQPRGIRPALFCSPGIGANVIYLHGILAHLDESRPCYGLQPPGYDGAVTMPDTIESLAAYHIREMQAVQPRGPYHLAGHCFGGKVAFEIASQLESIGESIGLLLILDSAAPASAKERGGKTARSEVDWLWLAVEIVAQSAKATIGFDKEMLKSQATLEDSYVLAARYIERQGMLFAPGAGSGQLKTMVENLKIQSRAHRRYRPRVSLGSSIVLFRAIEELKDHGFQWEDWDWSPHTLGQVTVEWVPGNHFTMFEEPHVKALTAGLRAYLP